MGEVRIPREGRGGVGGGCLQVGELGGEGVDGVDGLRLEAHPLPRVRAQQRIGRQAPRREPEQPVQCVARVGVLPPPPPPPPSMPGTVGSSRSRRRIDLVQNLQNRWPFVRVGQVVLDGVQKLGHALQFGFVLGIRGTRRQRSSHGRRRSKQRCGAQKDERNYLRAFTQDRPAIQCTAQRWKIPCWFLGALIFEIHALQIKNVSFNGSYGRSTAVLIR